MIVQVIGKKSLDFSTRDGQAIKGMNLYVMYKEEGTEGFRADKVFVREGVSIPKEMKINDTVDISYNNRGKIEGITLI